MKKYLPFLSVLFIAACAAPTTMAPQVGQREIQAEGRNQEQYVKEAQAQAKAAQGASTSTATSAQMQARVSAVKERVSKAAASMCADMGLDPRACVYDVEIAAGAANEKESLNAYADGKKVFFTPAMINFASSDTELALVMAHEFAHNIMGHVNSQQKNTMLGGLAGILIDAAAASQGYNTQGTFSQLGAQTANLRYSAAFENEADYVGLFILARAGYDFAKGPEFWRRMSVDNPKAIYTQTTHPSNSARFVALNKTIQEINAKKSRGAPLVPEFIKQ